MADQEKAASATSVHPKARSPVAKIAIGAVALVVIAVGSAVAGARFAPMLGGRAAAAEAAKHDDGAAESDEEDEAEEEKSEGPTEVVDSVFVDVRDDKAGGEIHHLKVGMAVEFKAKLGEEDWKKFAPRVKNAALSYLRGLRFDEVTDPTRFEAIQKELHARVRKAIGRKGVRHVLVTDFVVQ